MIVSLSELRNEHGIPATAPSALDRGQRTLHIRCGHDIMHKLAAAGFEGDFLWFADPYCQGPVPRTDSLEQFVRIRARYLEDAHEAHDAFDRLYESYRDLERTREYELVTIWMEHDSYDQLVLAKLLELFSDPARRPARLQLISVTHFPGVERFIGIGQLPPEALRALWNDFEDVSERQLALGTETWAALTASSPEALLDLVKTGTPALPTMAKALGRHLGELPSTRNGLSLTEELTLRILLDKGPMNAPRLFGWYTNHYEPLPSSATRVTGSCFAVWPTQPRLRSESIGAAMRRRTRIAIGTWSCWRSASDCWRKRPTGCARTRSTAGLAVCTSTRASGRTGDSMTAPSASFGAER